MEETNENDVTEALVLPVCQSLPIQLRINTRPAPTRDLGCLC